MDDSISAILELDHYYSQGDGIRFRNPEDPTVAVVISNATFLMMGQPQSIGVELVPAGAPDES